LLIDTYITDKNEKDFLLKAISNIDVIREKAQWAMKWMDQSTKTFH
jgi:hypothetical protein